MAITPGVLDLGISFRTEIWAAMMQSNLDSEGNGRGCPDRWGVEHVQRQIGRIFGAKRDNGRGVHFGVCEYLQGNLDL
jgi:hypothetical protein